MKKLILSIIFGTGLAAAASAYAQQDSGTCEVVQQGGFWYVKRGSLPPNQIYPDAASAVSERDQLVGQGSCRASTATECQLLIRGGNFYVSLNEDDSGQMYIDLPTAARQRDKLIRKGLCTRASALPHCHTQPLGDIQILYQGDFEAGRSFVYAQEAEAYIQKLIQAGACN